METLTIVSIFLTFSIIINLITVYILWKMFFQILPNREEIIDVYEEFFTKSKEFYQTTLMNMRRIDLRGAFESDDEVGYAFKFIKKSIEDIDALFKTTKELNVNNSPTQENNKK